ncbi:MAG: NUDIX domain-containing protein [Gammaproteobacteria bacterium]|nr:NUDIX domain-containing protein [Gammaproteobacteria bacterium]
MSAVTSGFNPQQRIYTGGQTSTYDSMRELFETFDDNGNFTGLVARDLVHSLGLWHKSACVFLFNSNGELYVQRRATDKDLFADQWDYSVGEHLKPGESYLDGALRGLIEELGIHTVVLASLGLQRKSCWEIPEQNVRDCEMQQAYRGVYDGVIKADPLEVAEVRAISLAALETWIAAEPASFTPWFLRDLTELGIFRPTGSTRADSGVA